MINAATFRLVNSRGRTQAHSQEMKTYIEIDTNSEALRGGHHINRSTANSGTDTTARSGLPKKRHGKSF